MPNRFARCQNTDYCSLADQRLVLRLAEDESFYCPECAHPLTPAPPWGQRGAPWAVLGAVGMAGAAAATCLLVAQNWPSAMAYMPPSVSTAASAALAFLAPAAPPPPDLVALITGTAPADTLPTPQQFLVAATMDSWLPHQAGDHVLRRRHPRPPRADPAAAAARASLEAGVPPFRGMEAADLAASMPWRQALIMAALVTPSQPTPIAAAPAPPQPAPLEPAPLEPASLKPAPPPSSPPPSTIQTNRPHAALLTPPSETDATSRLELALADGFIRGIRQDDSSLTDHILLPQAVPTPAPTAALTPALTPLAPVNLPPTKPAPAPAAANPPTAIAHAPPPPTPRHPEPTVNRQAAKSPAAKSPAAKSQAKTAASIARNTAATAAIAAKIAHPATRQIASARIPASRPTVATNILAPAHRLLSQSTAAPPAASPPPPRTAIAPRTTAPQPRAVVLAPTSSGSFTGLKYGALKDTNLQSIPTVPATEKLTGGSMMVDCEVPANGVPTDCKLLQSDKSPAVAHAVLAMLTSGLVHKTPKSDHGRLVRQSWPINFPANQPHRTETFEPDDPTP